MQNVWQKHNFYLKHGYKFFIFLREILHWSSYICAQFIIKISISSLKQTNKQTKGIKTHTENKITVIDTFPSLFHCNKVSIWLILGWYLPFNESNIICSPSLPIFSHPRWVKNTKEEFVFTYLHLKLVKLYGICDCFHWLRCSSNISEMFYSFFFCFSDDISWHHTSRKRKSMFF